MPHQVTAFAGMFSDAARGALPRRFSQPVPSTARWSPTRAHDWSAETGWLVGANFTPSTASNQLELWQPDTFDPDTIDRELGWAAELGFNSVRVFLHDLLWADEGQGFLDRVDEFLSIADDHGISTMPVLFDGVWDPEPHLGRQRAPRPGLHNSTWVQGPGSAVLRDPDRWPSLRPYVDAVLERFGDDPRIAVWDLFNEPDQRNAISYARQEVSHKTRLVDALLNQVFDWAQAVDPSQPLTAGVFTGVSGATERVSRINRTMLGRSDVISFHSYAPERRLVTAIDHLNAYDRPLLCTEWLGRTVGSKVELIETFAERDVGAYCWGLVDGASQTRYSWMSWLRREKDSSRWFHDLLHPDGRPYNDREAALIKRVANAKRSN